VREAVTDADGTAVFEGVPAGTASLLFDDAVVRSPAFTVLAGRSVDRTETLTAACDIEGIAVDSNGRPIADAMIWLSSTGGMMSPGYLAARTAADGTFAARALNLRWIVWATAPGHARSAFHRDNQSIQVSRPRLVLGASPASIAGTVRASDGRPLAGALVAAYPLAPARGSATGMSAPPSFERADGDGLFVLADLEPGPLLVVALAASACAQMERVEVGPGEMARVELRLGHGATLHGRAAAPSSTGLAVACADPRRADTPREILASIGSTTAVRSDGSWWLEHVCPGSLTVRLMRCESSECLARATIEVVEGQDAEVDLQAVRATVELAGRVVDDSGAGLAGIAVRSQPAEFDWAGMRREFGKTTTDTNGRFTFAVQPGITWRCFALQDRGFTLAASDAVGGGGAEVLLAVPAAARAGGGVRGLLLDVALTSEPVDLCLHQLPRGAFDLFAVGADGRFAIEPLPPGDFALAVRRGNRASRLAAFHLDAGKVLDLGALAIASPGELRVSLRRADGRPVRVRDFVTLYSRPEGIPIDRVQVPPDGTASLELAADEYDVAFEGDDFLPERRVVTVKSGQRSELIVALRPARCCSFTFTTPDATSPSRLWLVIRGPDGCEVLNRGLRAPDDGVYRAEFGLPPGVHRIRAVTAYGLLAEGEVIVPDGDPNGPPLAVEMALH
jgi:hypothetical protein